MDVAIFLTVIGFCVYFWPSICARNKRNFTAILTLNFFLGWTLIGWVIALVWAVAYERELSV
jgi:hypothetical protein